MPGQEPILADKDRSKLDTIVMEMTKNKESDSDIQAVVDDFKSKYAKVPESAPDTTVEPVKKKEEEKSDLVVSPQGSLETKQKPETSSTLSESDTPFHETIFETIFGNKEKPVNKKQELVDNTSVNDISDEKGSALNIADAKLSKTGNIVEKGKANERVVNFRNNFYNGTLTPEDISIIPGDLSGVSDKDAAERINNKTNNLKVWGNVAMMKGINFADQNLQILDKEIQFAKNKFGDNSAEIRGLENKREFLNHSITQVYNAEADKASGELVTNLKNSLDGPIKYDPYTNTVDEKSQFYIRKSVDDYLNIHPNEVINYKTSGNTKDGKRNYPDIANRVVNYFNTVIPVQRAHDKVAKDIIEKYPQAKGLISHIKQLDNYFSGDNVQKIDAGVKAFQDKSFLGVNERYFGATGILTGNSEFATIQRKYQELVKKKEMPESVATEQIQAEVNQNKNLKKIYDNYTKDVDKVQTDAKKMWGDYLITGLKKIDPSLTAYENGNVGIDGLNQTESKKIMDEYNDELAKSTAKTLHDQSEKLGHRADKAAAHIGSFWTSFVGSVNDMQGAFSKYLFDKTGWGGQAVEMYQAKQDANIPISQSEQARKWNWQGLRSLKDYNFYLSAIGSQIPLFGGAAAVTAATKGAGLPEYIGWLSAAGLFDATMSLQNYNEIAVNGKDKFGNKLTEYDAAKAAANQFNQSIVPDMLFMAANAGILSRAKNLSKPTLLKTLGTAGKGVTVGTIPMIWQGYAQYASQLEAEGKTPDLWDYAQDGKLAKSLIEGVVGGAFLQLFHVPNEHIRKTENWKRMVVTSTGEFHDNIMFSIGMGHEISGLGNQWRDAMKLHIATAEMSPAEKEDVKNSLLYSTALERNIKGGGIDIKNVTGAYQAHNLALADLHEQWAKENEGNPNLAKIYSEQAGDFRKEAKSAMEGKAKFHYLTDISDQPIFLSDQSFKVLDAEGKIADWVKTGTINGIHNSSDPGFDAAYKEKTKSKGSPEPEIKAEPVADPKVEIDDQTRVINALNDHAADLSGTFKMSVDANIGDPKNHEQLVKEIISQSVDHPNLAKEMLGDQAWEKIKPIVEEKKKEIETERREREKINKKYEPDPEQVEKSNKILNQKIDGIDTIRKARKKINFEGEKVRSDIVVDKLKDRHSRLEDIIKNCL